MTVDIQRANMWKRIAAAMLDGILLLVLFSGGLWATSEIISFDTWEARYNDKIAEYEALYDSDYYATNEDLESMTPEARARYDAMIEAYYNDPDAAYIENMATSLFLTMILLPIFFSFLILEFFVPLILGNGQTVGKKVFGLALMRTDGVKLTPFALFVRSMLGKCTIETMVPVAAVLVAMNSALGVFAPTVIFGMLAIQLGMLVLTQNRSCIHDLMSVTVAIDYTSQEIFDSIDDLIQRDQEIAAAKAQRQDY